MLTLLAQYAADDGADMIIRACFGADWPQRRGLAVHSRVSACPALLAARRLLAAKVRNFSRIALSLCGNAGGAGQPRACAGGVWGGFGAFAALKFQTTAKNLETFTTF